MIRNVFRLTLFLGLPLCVAASDTSLVPDTLIGLYPTGDYFTNENDPESLTFVYLSEPLSGTPDSAPTLMHDTLRFTQWDTEWSIQVGRHETIHIKDLPGCLERSDPVRLRCRLTFIGNRRLETTGLKLSHALQKQCRPEVLLTPARGIQTTKTIPQPSLLGWLFGAKSPVRFESDSDRPFNFVMLMVDTLRRDHLPSYGHPFIVAPHSEMLASLGTVFLRSYSTASNTRPSVGSMFTGLYPKAHGAIRHASQSSGLHVGVPVLADAFHQNGFSTIAVNSNAQIRPALGFGRGFDAFTDPPVWESQVTPFGLRELKTIDEPFFLYVHYMGPHSPYNPASPWNSMYRGLSPYSEQDAYCAEVTIEDQRIGLILKELAAQGLLDRTIVWLMSDHGEEFWEHGWNGHGAKLYEETVQTISILACPAKLPMGMKIDVPISQIDLLPTLVDFYQWKPPAVTQGLSLLPLLQAQTATDRFDRPMFFHHGGGINADPDPSDKAAVLYRNKKLIWWLEKNETETNDPVWELYNLEADPAEQNNLLIQPGHSQEDPATLKQMLQDHLAECLEISKKFDSFLTSGGIKPLTKEDKENLQAHDYNF